MDGCTSEETLCFALVSIVVETAVAILSAILLADTRIATTHPLICFYLATACNEISHYRVETLVEMGIKPRSNQTESNLNFCWDPNKT